MDDVRYRKVSQFRCRRHNHELWVEIEGDTAYISPCWECLEDTWQGGKKYAEEIADDWG